MSFLGLEIEKAPRGMRLRRLAAFTVDVLVLFLLLSLAFQLTGEPDFFRVRAAMDAAASAQDPALTAAVFESFNAAYATSLLIWFGYEVVTQLLFGGATLGKLLLGLRVCAYNPERKLPMQWLMLVLRSALKMFSLYLFQGFPFLICYLTLFTNPLCQSGFDKAVRTVVIRRTNQKELIAA